MRGIFAVGSFIASGNFLTSGMTAGSLPSRMAWQNVFSWRWVMPSLNRKGMEDSTTSRCWVVPSSRLRNATLSCSDFFAVCSSSAICCSASERFLPMRVLFPVAFLSS